jgi:hypothetical protein
MMGMRTPETCSAVRKRQVINLRSCCILLVDVFKLYDDLSIEPMLRLRGSIPQFPIRLRRLGLDSMSCIILYFCAV